MSEDKRQDKRLGDLLVEFGLVDKKDIGEALKIASEIGMPLGRVMIMSGFLTEEQLQSAVQLQSMLKDRMLEMPVATKACELMVKQGLTLKDALDKAGWAKDAKEAEVKATKLGDLLLASQFVTKEQLEEALSRSFSTGLPFGRLLVLSGSLPEQLLESALNAQILIRDQRITRDQAIDGLRAAKTRQIAVEVPLMDKGLYRLPSHKTIRLGELLVLASLISEADLMYAVEMGLVNQKPIGKVLIELGLITEEILAESLKVQEAVSHGQLSPLAGAQVLRDLKSGLLPPKPTPPPDFMPPPPPPKRVEPEYTLGQFLKLAGVISDQDIEKAVEISIQNSQILGRMLLLSGIVEESTLQAALRCLVLLKEQSIKTEQAFIAFNYSQRSRLTIDESMSELGWMKN